MKKQYMIPSIDVIEIKTAGMLATSLPISETEVDAGSSLAPGMEQNPMGLPSFVFE